MTSPNIERNRLIMTHQHLCGRAARKFLRRSADRCDLEQVAAIGLIKAADRYDLDQGVPFEAYAWVLMLGELMHYVRDTERVIRAPRRLQELERRWINAERDLWVQLNREPNAKEVGAHLGLSKRDHEELCRYRLCSAVLSTEALRSTEQRVLSYNIDHHVDRLTIEASLALLTPTERTILREIYEEDVPVAQVAQRLGYSRRHVSRLRKSALEKLSPLSRHESA